MIVVIAAVIDDNVLRVNSSSASVDSVVVDSVLSETIVVIVDVGIVFTAKLGSGNIRFG